MAKDVANKTFQRITNVLLISFLFPSLQPPALPSSSPHLAENRAHIFPEVSIPD